VGAVRKLATVVIIGLVALSTLMVVYLAAEPDRRGSETSEQQSTMLVRGTELYITYCLQCHGPAGLGAAGRDGRVGGILNQDAVIPEGEQGDLNANFQSDDPVARSVAEDWIRFRIAYGVPPDPIAEAKVMPAFANDLNVEEMNALVYLIMDGDWNYVYNTIVHETGVHVAEEECLENPDAEYCDDVSQAPPVYPTAPPAGGNPNAESDEAATPESADEGAADDAAASEGESAAGASEGGEAAASLEAQDIAWSQTELSVKPGDTIEMTNTGQLPHDFTVDELGIQEVTPTNGDTVMITIPEDAEAGEFEFYCSVPGHKEAGMVGTLIIEAP
jgi:plastocyanin/mono/diheme cytochrome c family protein